MPVVGTEKVGIRVVALLGKLLNQDRRDSPGSMPILLQAADGISELLLLMSQLGLVETEGKGTFLGLGMEEGGRMSEYVVPVKTMSRQGAWQGARLDPVLTIQYIIPYQEERWRGWPTLSPPSSSLYAQTFSSNPREWPAWCDKWSRYACLAPTGTC